MVTRKNKKIVRSNLVKCSKWIIVSTENSFSKTTLYRFLINLIACYFRTAARILSTVGLVFFTNGTGISITIHMSHTIHVTWKMEIAWPSSCTIHGFWFFQTSLLSIISFLVPSVPTTVVEQILEPIRRISETNQKFSQEVKIYL
jgi:hypothetical protein